jgi:hypothetical protein
LLVCSAFRFGTSYNAIFGWALIGNITFYFAIHNQSYTGLFKLDKINGVDEGILYIYIL